MAAACKKALGEERKIRGMRLMNEDLLFFEK